MDDLQIYYAGENARQTYAYAAPALNAAFKSMKSRTPRFEWDRANNTLKVLIVTPADIDPTGKYKTLDWTIVPACETNNDKSAVDLLSYTHNASKKFHAILRNAAKAGFIPEAQLTEALLDDPGSVATLNQLITHAALSQQPMAKNVGALLPQVGKDYVIVSMHDQPPPNFMSTLSGLNPMYLKNLRGTDKDWSIAILGHEILGHGLHAHQATENEMYSCSGIDYAISDHVAQQEGLSDIALMNTFKAAQALGLTSQTDIGTSLESVRILGAFFQAQNGFLAKTSASIPGHITTLYFDPQQPDFTSMFNHVSVKGVSALPSLINTYADIIAGYVFIQQQHAELKKNPKKFSAEEKALFKDPEGSVATIENFAFYGYLARTGRVASPTEREIKADPAYHTAAMTYLQKSQGLEILKSHIAPALHPAFDDLISDYFRAVATHSTLPSAHLNQTFDTILKKAGIDYNLISAQLFGLPVKGVAASELKEYRTGLGLDTSIPAYIRK